MAGFNPLAALGANAVSAAQQAIEQSTLQLGVSAEVLQAQLSVGDLIAATILPASGGNDLLQIFGQTVVAQLPTGVYPGETLLLAVTGFSGNNIMVQNLGLADPTAPLPTVDLQFPVEEGAPLTATLTTTPAPAVANGSAASAAAQTTPSASGAAQAIPATPAGSPAPQTVQVPPNASSAPPAATAVRGSQPMAPPPAVFVAASVRPSAVSGAPSGPSAAPANATAAPTNATAASAADIDIEARIAALRTASPDGSARVVPAPPGVARGASQRAPQVAPPIISRGLPQTPPIMRAAGALPNAVAASRSAADAQQSAVPRLPNVATSPEASLLSRLRVPLTATTTAAAKLIDQAAQAIPRTFATLESLLARVADDPRVASLRSMLGFTSKLDPSNARALPEQLAAFVNDVLDGAESKMAAIVRAFSESEPTLSTATPSTTAPTTPTSPTATSAAAVAAEDAAALPAGTLVGADPSAGLQARVAERVAAMEYDVKAAIMTLLQSPPSGTSPQLTQALSEALTAITAVQLNALNLQSANPNTIAIPLPMFYREGGQPTVLRIDRDGGNGKRMDSENFHVSFILDTESLGTVAIDLQAANRAVSVNVKTERASAADGFRSSLADLRGRLEGLHFRVAAIGADVAPARGAAEAPVSPPVVEALPEDRAPSKLDVQA